MSYHNENGGCAFPVSLEWAGPSKSPFTGEPIADGHTEQFASIGMSLRDYFAAKALGGMASAYHEHWTPERAAEAAYELADAMLKARAEK